MLTEREKRAYPKDKFRVISDINMVLMQMCPYDDCDGDAVIDAWEWSKIQSEHSDYPEVSEEGQVYPMHKQS